MPNVFDGLKTAMMDVVTDLFGYDAIWVDANNGNAVLGTGRVLFKAPTKKADLQEQEYHFDFYTAEYRAGVFTGLMAYAAQPSNKATLSIEGALFRVREVTRKYDGDVYIALLDKPNQ